jgi:hypothetical protein
MSLYTLNSHQNYWLDNIAYCLKAIPLSSIPASSIKLFDNRAIHLMQILDKLYLDAANNRDTDCALFLESDWNAVVYVINLHFVATGIDNRLYRPNSSNTKYIRLKNINK